MSLNRRRIINVVLVVSLALNLFVFGGMAARMMSFHNNGRPIPPNLNWVIRQLDEDTRANLQSTLDRYGEETGPVRHALFLAQRKVNELLIQNPLDTEAIEAAFAALRAAGEEYQELSHRQTLALFTQLSPQEREEAMRFIQERSRPPRERERERSTPDDTQPPR
ncbi:MAG: periplasmic heavy metal sensor [Pseudomonadales bacterium]|nr:periplasmic heavy metal sensor [Pseudomonadales bacterium]MCP5329694.1 periplasmic heavy metal sensor [Pseudomonadales bacterium]MCP5343767.1 periplasmic heavy metal sensor [Pseudomonadales bacterium]